MYPQKWGTFAVKDWEIKLGNMEQDNQRSDNLNVANTGSSPIKVTFENVTPGLKISVSPNPIPANSTAKLTYTVTADRSQWGKSWYYATPVVDGKRYKGDGKVISIWAYIKENFAGMSQDERNKGAQPMFASSTYNFGKIKAGTPVEATYSFTNQGKSDLVVYKVDSDSPAAKPGTVAPPAPSISRFFALSYMAFQPSRVAELPFFLYFCILRGLWPESPAGTRS